MTSVTLDDNNLERIYDALEVKRGRVARSRVKQTHAGVNFVGVFTSCYLQFLSAKNYNKRGKYIYTLYLYHECLIALI